EGRGRRLSERRQVLAGQPPDAEPRGGGSRARGHHARSQGALDRVERPPHHADRHRRRRSRRQRPAVGLDPGSGPCRPRRRAGRPLRGRRPRRPAPRRSGDRRHPAPRGPARGGGGQQDRLAGRHRARPRVPRPRPGGAAAGLGRPGPRHRRPAGPAGVARARRRGSNRGRRRRGPPGRHRATQRRQVLAGQRVPRTRPHDRLRRRRHHARRDRHADRGRGAAHAAGRHRRHPARGQGPGVGRVLHRPALAARRRARRCRAGGLRRHRRRHLAGPAHRRAGDEVGLRDGAGAQQVGPDRSRRGRTRPRAGARRAEAAPAPARADRLGQDRPPHQPAAAGGALAGRPGGPPHPHARAQPVPLRARRGAPAAGQAGQAAAPALHLPVRGLTTALRHPGELARAADARLRVLRREPAARALRDGRDPADHRLPRAQGQGGGGPRGLGRGQGQGAPWTRQGRAPHQLEQTNRQYPI
ncbi:MAG: GTP-binding protein EngA, partial [uncultured Solirubrobacteraceae bacterium]